jgi:uncharacterized membrane protein YphA (DoxX/SURF4 family)
LIPNQSVSNYLLQRQAAVSKAILWNKILLLKKCMMKQRLQNFLFGSSVGNNKLFNAAWLFFRLHIGLSMAIHAGFPKIETGVAPAWFVDQVQELGFTFISPSFWATISAYGEFIGGLLIAIGLFTRIAALQLAFQFFVISFIWYSKPEPLTGMYFQQLYFWCYIILVFSGSGLYSIDQLIKNRKIRTFHFAPAATIASVAVLLFLSFGVAAQKPVTGSGVIIKKSFDFKNFDKLIFNDLHGKITVSAGKSFSILVQIDDNLSDLFEASEMDGMLKMKLKNNEKNSMYIENTHIQITIAMPAITQLKNNGNSNVLINQLKERFFIIENSGNGDTKINGITDTLDISNSGNGDISAANCFATEGRLQKSGNGDLEINIANNFTVNSSGNGDIINYGTGKAIVNKLEGNGKLIYKNKDLKKRSLP